MPAGRRKECVPLDVVVIMDFSAAAPISLKAEKKVYAGHAMTVNSRDERLVHELENAADKVADLPLAELQALLRRAANRLKCQVPPSSAGDPGFDLDKFPR
jgi:hypothetical protein